MRSLFARCLVRGTVFTSQKFTAFSEMTAVSSLATEDSRETQHPFEAVGEKVTKNVFFVTRK